MIDDNPPEFVPGPPAIDYHVFHEPASSDPQTPAIVRVRVKEQVP